MERILCMAVETIAGRSQLVSTNGSLSILVRLTVNYMLVSDNDVVSCIEQVHLSKTSEM